MGDDVEFTQEYGAGLVFNDNSVNYKYVYFAPAGGGSYASPTAVFNDSSINADTGSLEMHGTTTFNHQSHCTGQVWGDPTITFNDDSVYDAVNSVARWNEGTYYFRGNSYIASGAFLGSGDAEAGPLTSYFYDQSQCQSSGASWNNPYSPYEYLSYPVQKTGHTYIRQHAADFLAWIDYFYASNFQGTLHLQFPEMDILGTGLL